MYNIVSYRNIVISALFKQHIRIRLLNLSNYTAQREQLIIHYSFLRSFIRSFGSAFFFARFFFLFHFFLLLEWSSVWHPRNPKIERKSANHQPENGLVCPQQSSANVHTYIIWCTAQSTLHTSIVLKSSFFLLQTVEWCYKQQKFFPPISLDELCSFNSSNNGGFYSDTSRHNGADEVEKVKKEILWNN